jgi:GxxExxY protein
MHIETDDEPRMNVNERQLDEVVVAAAYEVANVLGAGFLEKVYERALASELRSRGLKVATQVSFCVSYKGQGIGEYFADLVVQDAIVVEVKCVEAFSNEHLAQCINYLKVSGKHLALLVNFRRSKIEWRRVFLGYGREGRAVNEREST